MADPAEKFDPVEAAHRDMQPSLYKPEHSDELSHEPHSTAANTLRSLEGRGETTPRKKNHLRSVDDSSSLDSRENSDSSLADKLGAGFTGLNKRRKGWITRQRAQAAGLIFGLLTGATIGLSPVLKPFEAIHYGRLLGMPMGINENHSARKMARILMYSRTNLSGRGTGQSLKASTRLGVISVKAAGVVNENLDKAGVKYSFDKYGMRSGLSIDPNKHPKYSKLSPAEAKIQMARDLGISPDKIMGNAEHGGRLRANISPDRVNIKTARGFFMEQVRLANGTQASSNAFVAGLGRMSTWLQARAMTKYLNLPSAFHPLKKSEVKTREWALGKLKNGEQKAKQTKAYEKYKSARQARAKAVSAQNLKAKATLEKIKSKTSGLSGKVGGALMITGAVCLVRDTAELIPEMNRQALVMPAVNSALEGISAGSQHESGDDIDVVSSQTYVDGFYDEESKTSVWDDPFIRNRNGQSGGYDGNSREVGVVLAALSPDGTYQNIVKGLDEVGAGTLCSPVGKVVQMVAGGILLALGPGGWVAKAATTGIGMVAMSIAVDSVTKQLAEKPLDFTSHMGAMGGAMDAIGSAELANISARNSGGTRLTQSQYSVLQQELEKEQRSTNLIARLFDVKNPKSAAGRTLIASYSSTSGQQVNSVFTLALRPLQNTTSGPLASILKLPSAAAENEVTFTEEMIPRYGFSKEHDDKQDLLAEEYDGTDTGYFEHLDAATATALSGPNGSSLIERAHACFAANIFKDTEGIWTWSLDAEYDPHPASQPYAAANCGDTSPEFMTIINFIDNSQSLESFMCLGTKEGDYCDNATGSSKSSTPQPGNTTLVPPPAGKFASPIPGYSGSITNCWRKPGHTGIDFATPTGTPILAANNGIVVEAGDGGDAGNYVMLKHDNGLWTNYQHLSSVGVGVGNMVRAGQEIGKSGNTGYSTGPHLHFSITDAPTLSSRSSGTNTLDPVPYLDEANLNFGCR